MSEAGPLHAACRAHDVLVLYLFGSRADDGLRRLTGVPVAPGGSDVDVGVVFGAPEVDHRRLAALQVALEDVFAPLRVDIVPLQRVDALFQYAAVSGHRVFEANPTRVAEYELLVMRRAAELAPIQRHIEREVFGLGERP